MCPTHQVPIEEVGELVESGTITAETEVMVEGMQNFVGLAEFVQMHGLEEELSITSTKTAARRRNFSAEVLADVGHLHGCSPPPSLPTSCQTSSSEWQCATAYACQYWGAQDFANTDVLMDGYVALHWIEMASMRGTAQ